MEAFLYWFFAPLLAVGSALVILKRRPLPAVWGLALIHAASVVFFLFSHLVVLACLQAISALAVMALLLRLAARMPVFPGETGAVLRPFGVICGAAVALFFGGLVAKAAHGIAGSGHGEAAFLFSAGLVGLVARRNLFIALLSLQMLLQAAALFAVCGAPSGLGLAFCIVALGLVQGVAGTALLRVFLRERGTLRVEELTAFKF